MAAGVVFVVGDGLEEAATAAAAAAAAAAWAEASVTEFKREIDGSRFGGTTGLLGGIGGGWPRPVVAAVVVVAPVELFWLGGCCLSAALKIVPVAFVA